MGKQLTSIELPDDLRNKVDRWRERNGGTLVGTIIKGLELLIRKENSEGEKLSDGEIVKNWREAESEGVKPMDVLAKAIKERILRDEY